MTELQEEVIEIIEKELIFGFLEEDELLEEVLETFLDEDVDPTWIGEQVNILYAKKLEEIDEWDEDEIYDFDRLADAFDELSEQKIISLHRAGYSDEDGIEEVTEAFKELVTRGIRPRGYVFYQSEQLENVLSDEPHLTLTFGASNNSMVQIREIGNLIVETLKRYELEVSWDGKPGSSIVIEDIFWQKEPDDEDWGIERSVAIMSGEETIEDFEDEV